MTFPVLDKEIVENSFEDLTDEKKQAIVDCYASGKTELECKHTEFVPSSIVKQYYNKIGVIYNDLKKYVT